jgi:hypothetical protein
MQLPVQLLLFFMISASAFSQDPAEIMTGVLNRLGKNIPSDQLFLHLDRNLYHPGDTIRFQAFIRDSRTGEFTTESSSLYTLLLNSRHSTIDSARFRIDYPAIPGWLKVPETITPGDYTILSFTSNDMNYGPEYAFRTAVRIDNILPSRDKTEKERKDKSKDKEREVAIPSDELPPGQPSADLRFLPEGGTFIYGIRQRIAFNAVRPSGKGLKVNGEITNQRGEKIAVLRSSPFGPGEVEFTPLRGDIYFATLEGEDFRGMKWPLPSPERSGVAMRVNNRDHGLIEITLRGRETEGRPYFLTITMNNILVFSENVTMDTLFRKSLRTDKLPSGTAFITLYDPDLNPVAERLIFLNDFKKMNVSLEVSSPQVLPGEETGLTINTTDYQGNRIGSVVSVAVIDSSSGYYNGMPMPEIGSVCLYDKGFYENLPFSIRSLGLNNIDSNSIDLLLLTYGWRRFYPKEIVPDNSEKELVNYDYLKITNTGPVKKRRSSIRLIPDTGIDVISLPVNGNSEAVLQYDSLDPGARQVMILPDADPAKNNSPVRVVFPQNKDYTDKAKSLSIQLSYLTPDYQIRGESQPDFKLNGYIMIEPVTIRAPLQPLKPKAYIDKPSVTYRSTGATTWYKKDFGQAYTLEDILYKYNPYLLDNNIMVGPIRGKRIFLRNTTPYIRAHSTESDGKDGFVNDQLSRPALFVVDNNPIGFDYDDIAQMPVSAIASITFLRGVQGVPIYGIKANGGVVFITTKTGSGFTDEELESMNEPVRNDDLLKEIRIFRTETEYYIPTKEEVDLIPEFQFRSTILWKANLFIGESGPAIIKYPNNLVKGTAIVIVNGISFTNQVGSGRCSYTIK